MYNEKTNEKVIKRVKDTFFQKNWKKRKNIILQHKTNMNLRSIFKIEIYK